MAFYYGHVGNIFLDDPHAIADWYLVMEGYIRYIIERNLKIALNTDMVM